VQSYFEQQTQVEDRIEELKEMIAEDTEKKREILLKLNEFSSTE
jgi:hypothetical protein